MKPTNRLLALGAVCSAIALSSVTAPAQTATPATTVTRTADDRDEDHDYGWIGLLGLLGLAGLMKKKHDDHRHDMTAGRTDVRQ